MNALASPDLDLHIREETTFSLDDGDHEKFSHYVDKTDLLLAAVEGTPCVAICGKKWLPTRDGEKFPICPDCKEIYAGLPTGNDGTPA